MKLQRTFLVLVLLLASACDKQPTEVLEDETRWPVYITFKGRVEFSDGTVFASPVEKRVRLPRHLWGYYVREKVVDLKKTSAYANFYYEFVPSGTTVTIGAGSYLTYEKSNCWVCGCMTDWQTRSIVTVVDNSTSVARHWSVAFDSSIPGGALYSEYGYIYEHQTGTFYSTYSLEYDGDFSSDDDVDIARVRLFNGDQGTGTITFSSIKIDLLSNDSACTPC